MPYCVVIIVFVFVSAGEISFVMLTSFLCECYLGLILSASRWHVVVIIVCTCEWEVTAIRNKGKKFPECFYLLINNGDLYRRSSGLCDVPLGAMLYVR